MTLTGVKKEVSKLDKNMNPRSLEYKAAVIMLSALEVGADEKKVASFTKYPAATVKAVSKNLRKNKIWVKNKTHADWFDEKHGGIAFFADVAVAVGYLKRTSETKARHA